MEPQVVLEPRKTKHPILGYLRPIEGFEKESRTIAASEFIPAIPNYYVVGAKVASVVETPLSLVERTVNSVEALLNALKNRKVSREDVISTLDRLSLGG